MVPTKRVRVNIRRGEGMLFNSSHHEALARLLREAEESPSSDADKSRLDKSLPGMTYLSAGRGGGTRSSEDPVQH